MIIALHAVWQSGSDSLPLVKNGFTCKIYKRTYVGLAVLRLTTPEVAAQSYTCTQYDAFYTLQHQCGVPCNSHDDCGNGEECLCDGKCGLSCLVEDDLPQCVTPPHPNNGITHVENNHYGSLATFTCNDGHILIGHQTAVCMSSGSWDVSLPHCLNTQDVSENCDKADLPVVVYATRDDNNDDDDDDDDDDSTGTADIGQVVSYTCQDGYYIVGSMPSVTCQSDGTWSDIIFTCWEVSCGNPEAPNNGVLDNYDFSYGAVVSITCESGYHMEGTDIVVTECQSDGTWSEQEVTLCQPVVCPDIDLSEGAPLYIEGVYSITYGSQLIFTCPSGYRLLGVSVIQCKSDGSWTDNVPTCEAISCGMPDTGNDVLIQSQGNTFAYGDVVEFMCKSGTYKTLVPADSESRMCTSDGTWSGDSTLCVKACPPLPDLANPSHTVVSEVKLHGFTTVVGYHCRSNYKMGGHSRLKCDTDTGQWDSTDVPSCSYDESGFSRYEVRAFPNALVNGEMTVNQWDTVFLDCLIPVSYRWMGRTRWYRPNNDVARGTQFPVGYRSWYRFSLNQIQHEDAGEYRCGMFEANVFEPTVFTNITLHVIPKCYDPRPEISGHVQVTEKKSFNESDIVIFICDTGYKRNGTFFSTCQNDGTWSGVIPNCYKECREDALADPANGYSVYEYTGRTNAVQTFFCYHGYHLDDPSNQRVQCNDGIWLGNTPSCIPVSCPNEYIQAPSNGAISGHLLVYNIGTTISFTCDENFAMYGSDRCVCQDDGQWDCQIPQCLPASSVYIQHGTKQIENSDPPIEVYSGNDVFLDCKVINNAISGQSVDDLQWYRMDSNGQRMNGRLDQYLVLHETCLRLAILNVETHDAGTYQCGSQTMASPLTIQVLNACPIVSPPDHGEVDAFNTRVGTIVNYECSEYYHLQGSSQRTCQSNGVWTGEDPVCQVYSCGLITFPTNGRHTGQYIHEGLVGETLEFICNLGYVLRGARFLQCQDDGTWSASKPTCTSKCELQNCGYGQYCTLSGGDPVCHCLDVSQCPNNDEPICGKDAVTYQSDCHRAVEECLTGSVIVKSHDGECGQIGLCHIKPEVHSDTQTCSPVYYWDDENLVCKRTQKYECLLHGGFTTYEECKHHCANICTKPIETGQCSQTTQRWGYDGTHCVSFQYTGCDGNENNFASKDECIVTCPTKISCTHCQPAMDLLTACRLANYAIKAKLVGIWEYTSGTQFDLDIENVLQGKGCPYQCRMKSALHYDINHCQCPHLRILDSSYLLIITKFNDVSVNYTEPIIDRGTFVTIWNEELEMMLNHASDCQMEVNIAADGAQTQCVSVPDDIHCLIPKDSLSCP
ncbi:complement receptor type 2-like [Glandiceps talaboti]